MKKQQLEINYVKVAFVQVPADLYEEVETAVSGKAYSQYGETDCSITMEELKDCLDEDEDLSKQVKTYLAAVYMHADLNKAKEVKFYSER